MQLIEIEAANRHKLTHLFNSPFGGFLPHSILEGQTGRAYADKLDDPQFAVLELTDVPVCFLGGNASHPLAIKYLKGLSRITQIFISTPDFIPVTHQAQPGKIIERVRWGFSADSLDIERLKAIQTKIPPEFTIRRLDLDLAKQLSLSKNKFAEMHGSAFQSIEEFIENGVGFGAYSADNLACVGSSFVACREGIEIQIDTQPKYRGNGLASAVAASLMLYCIENDLEPGWDAATPISAALAEKLGYTPLGEYKMIIFTNSRFLVMLRNSMHWFRRVIGH